MDKKPEQFDVTLLHRDLDDLELMLDGEHPNYEQGWNHEDFYKKVYKSGLLYKLISIAREK